MWFEVSDYGAVDDAPCDRATCECVQCRADDAEDYAIYLYTYARALKRELDG